MRRFELGSMDRDFLAETDLFYPPTAMNGPIRYPDATVELIDFYARLTRRRAVLRLPYHALGSPLRVHIRCHRFGLEGTVRLSVNGVAIDEFLFGKTSYPWGGIQTIVHQEVAEKGPLVIETAVMGGLTPPEHLPEDMGLGIDWVEVEPMSKGARLRVGPIQTFWFYVFLFAAYFFSRASGCSPRFSIFLLVLAITAICSLTLFFPVETSMALTRLWVVFPFGWFLQRILGWAASHRAAPGLTADEAKFLARLTVLAILSHSSLVFFPNHHPPDIPLHGKQVAWLGELELTYDNLLLYSELVSRQITDGAVLMTLSRDDAPEAGLDGAFTLESGRTYGTPYPPFFYLLTYSATGLYDDLRFILEFAPILLASLMLVLVFLIAKATWEDPTVARMAALLCLLEISLWHHAHRGHGPGIFGAFFVLLYVGFIAAHVERLRSWKGVVGFAALTLVVALCYTVAFIQITLFFGIWMILSVVGEKEAGRRQLVHPLLGFCAGIAGALALYYGPYVVSFLAKGGVTLDRGGAYDAPATFFILRNQLRDTVRILHNGYPVYLGLSLLGLGLLRHWKTPPSHTRMLWAAVLTFALLLALKDPALLPRIFLHAKEDLFFAPFACLLGAVPLASLWKRRRGRPVVILVFAALLALAIRDQAFNANTLQPQPIAFSAPETWKGEARFA